MAYRINADQITTHYTSTLAEFTANLKYEDIPPEVRERPVAGFLYLLRHACSGFAGFPHSRFICP